RLIFVTTLGFVLGLIRLGSLILALVCVFLIGRGLVRSVIGRLARSRQLKFWFCVLGDIRVCGNFKVVKIIRQLGSSSFWNVEDPVIFFLVGQVVIHDFLIRRAGQPLFVLFREWNRKVSQLDLRQFQESRVPAIIIRQGLVVIEEFLDFLF